MNLFVDSFTSISFMLELFVAGNMLNGTILGWLGELRNLEVVDLFSSSFSGLIPSSLGNMSSLQELNVDINGLSGTPPDGLGELKDLRNLYLSANNLYGSVSNSLGRLSSLQELKLCENRLDGDCLKSHWTTQKIGFFSNSLSLNVSSGWSPSFQLESIRMLTCRLGTDFLYGFGLKERRVYSLHLSYTSISGMIPDWLWSTSPKLRTLDLLAIRSRVRCHILYQQCIWIYIR